MDSNPFSKSVSAGEAIRPWLMLGPFYEDVSDRVQGLTLFEKPGATTGMDLLREVVLEASGPLSQNPQEADLASFRGQTGRWSLVRRPESFLSWGTYNISNHLAAAFFTTTVECPEPGLQQWELHIGISSRVIVAVNGGLVYDTDQTRLEASSGRHAHRFGGELRPGPNVITLACFRIGRMARVGFRLALVHHSLRASVRTAACLSPEARAQVEAEVCGLRLDRDVFYPEHEVGLKLKCRPAKATVLRARLEDADGALVRERDAKSQGSLAMCQGSDLPDGSYRLMCTWLATDETPVTSTSFEIRKASPVQPLPGPERFGERRQIVLEHYARNVERRPIWTQVARYALGRYEQVDESAIRDTCDFIAARKDCADFVIQGILRLMQWERQEQRLSPEINALMKDTILGFKYWVDEPGDTVMYMGSENHRLLFHVAEWMAGQLFPLDEFINSRQRGLYHATKGRMYITEWLRQRGRFGFDEWHSNSYYPISMAPLFNVYDFAISEDAKLRQMAGAVLDYMLFNIAADSLEGVFGTTHGRSYGIYVKYPDFEGTSSTAWLAFGVGSLTTESSGMCPVSMATSDYVVPEILAAIATDDQAVVDSSIRQGLLRGAAQSANFIVHRTPDYLMSGLQDHRKGEYESSTHVAQITLRNKTVIFWSCPHTSGEGSGLRPDYWSGHTTLPRVVQYRNVLSLTWRLNDLAWMSHCWFEQAKFDEVRIEGNWAFGRVGGGFVGIYSQHGLTVGTLGQYAGRELVCAARENTWLAECGREADWDSFDVFVRALSATTIESRDGVIAYDSPSIGRFVTGWDVAPTVGGAPIQLHGYPLVDSPWAHSAFGSGELTIRYGDKVHEIWFLQ